MAAGSISLVAGVRLLGASPYGAEEVAFVISGGLGSLLAVGLAIFLFITADLRDETAKLDRLEFALGGRPLPDPRRLIATAPVDESAGRAAVPSAGHGPRAAFAVAVPVVLGGAILIHAWHRAAATPHLERALGGLFEGLIGVGLALFALAGVAARNRRSVVQRLHGLFGAAGLASSAPRRSPERPRPTEGPPPDRSDGDWTAPGLRRVHRRTCAALQPKLADARPVSTDDSALESCLLCHREA
ncbi:MAG TPA: hypothetical protein VHL53_11485 [Acidimicrobiia bacterium]|nr:hypothetical protein [Acidimicrobiia bacterium]